MKRLLRLLFACCAAAVVWAPTISAGEPGAEPERVKVAVVGGLALSGVWQQLAGVAQQTLDLEIETVLAAPKEQVVPAFIEGRAELLLIHGGDETFALEARGYAAPLRTWAYNDFVLAGPRHDPAGVAGARSGADAISRIHAAGQPVIAFRDPGSYNILRHLLERAGLVPGQLRLLPDSMPRPQQVLSLAEREQAYVLVGHIPVAFGKMASPGIGILYRGDPAMRRAYVVVTPGARHPADAAARAGAERVAAFLLSDRAQELLKRFGPGPGQSWLFPRSEALLIAQDGGSTP